MTKVGAFTAERSFGERSSVARMYRAYLAKASVTMFAFIVVAAYLLPLLYMVTTSLEQPSQVSDPGAPPWPAAPMTATYEGQSYPLYSVPFPDGSTRQLSGSLSSTIAPASRSVSTVMARCGSDGTGLPSCRTVTPWS